MKKRLVQKKKKSKRYLAEIAAAIVLVVALGGTGVYKMITKDAKEELQMNTKQEPSWLKWMKCRQMQIEVNHKLAM